MGEVEPKRLSHYALTEEIGSGRNGTVYRGFDMEQQRVVAVKVLHESIMAVHHFQKQAIARTMTVAQIDHPNIANVAIIEEIDGQYVIVSELVESKSIDEIHSGRRCAEACGTSNLNRFLSIALQLATGLQEAHRQMVIHGNIRPSNVLIDQEGVVKLTDFGLHQTPDAVAGEEDIEALRYLSPEQIDGRPPNFVSDLYSVGLVFYDLLYGSIPIQDGKTNEVRWAIKSNPINIEPLRERGIPGEIVLLVEKLTALKPEDRFANTEELLITLEAIGDFESSHQHSHDQTGSRWSPRQYVMVSVLILLLIIFWIIVVSYQN
jgi:serine/threonine-protein kinase